METRNLNEMELERMKKLLEIADQCRTDVLDDFISMIFDKIDCDVCPRHGECETEAAMKAGCFTLPNDIEPCWETMLNWISSGAG